MKYKKGQCYEILLPESWKKPHAWTYTHGNGPVKSLIRLGKKCTKKAGKAQRYEVEVLDGMWPYNTISTNHLNRLAKRAKAAEVLYGPNDIRNAFDMYNDVAHFLNGLAIHDSVIIELDSLSSKYPTK